MRRDPAKQRVSLPTELIYHLRVRHLISHLSPEIKYSDPVLTYCRDTTEVCQYLVESGLVSNKAAVAVTQPRRVAARSVAQRVAQEVGKGPLGTYVGYSVRFEHVYNEKTRIKFFTDGMKVHYITIIGT